MAKRVKKNYKLRITICIVFVAILLMSFLFEKQIMNFVNKDVAQISTDLSQCDFKVHFLDVGQADCILVEFPNDKLMLIDSGIPEAEDNIEAYLKNNIEWENGFVIDYFLITHPHEDHIGSAPMIFEKFEVLNFYRPNVYTASENMTTKSDNICNTNIFKETIEASVNENCNVEFFSAGTSNFTVGECEIDFLTPNKFSYDNYNNYSPIMKITYKNRSFMFTGDAEEVVEKEILKLYPADYLDVDVLKVGHHGSNTSSCKDFIKAVKPEHCVIQVGSDNSYGHPTENTLQTLKNVNANVYRNDENGNLVFGVKQEGGIVISVNKNNNIAVKLELWQIVLPVGVVGCYIILTIKIKKRKED